MHPVTKIFHRCWTWKSLPREGGIAEQDPLLMEFFDLFVAEIRKAERAQMERASKGGKK